LWERAALATATLKMVKTSFDLIGSLFDDRA